MRWQTALRRARKQRASVATLYASAADREDEATDEHKANAKARKHGRGASAGNRD
jgi:hypothetical protein